MAPSDNLWVEHFYYFVWCGGFHPFYDRCQDLIVPFYAVFAGLYDGLVSLLGLILSDWKLADSTVQEVETHVSVTFRLFFKGVGVPCFGVFEC